MTNPSASEIMPTGGSECKLSKSNSYKSLIDSRGKAFTTRRRGDAAFGSERAKKRHLHRLKAVRMRTGLFITTRDRQGDT